MQDASPDVESVPVNVIPTGWLYQPSWSACRATPAPVTTGGVESYLIATPVELTLPALSVQLAPTEPEGPSGPLYVPELQEAIPERPSLPLAVNPTGWLYQPFASGPRASDAKTLGGVESYLIGPKLREPLTFPAWAVNGAMVTGLLTPAGDVPGQSHPEGFLHDYPEYRVDLRHAKRREAEGSLPRSSSCCARWPRSPRAGGAS